MKSSLMVTLQIRAEDGLWASGGRDVNSHAAWSLSQCFSNLPFTSYIYTILPDPRTTFGISLTHLFKPNFKEQPEDNNRNTLTGIKIRKGHGPRDKKLYPKLEDREGQRHQSRAGRSRSGAGPKGWRSSKKIVTENALGEMAAPDKGEKNVSPGSESALR